MVPTANIFLVGLFSNKFPNYHPIQFYKLQKIYQIYEITFKDITSQYHITFPELLLNESAINAMAA